MSKATIKTGVTAPTIQARIHRNVGERGYLVGYSANQLAARQVIKLFEELAETLHTVLLTDSPLAVEFAEFKANAVTLGGRARSLFDKHQGWSRQHVYIDLEQHRAELADIQVVLAVAATEAGVYDIMGAALRKSGADVERGVRGAPFEP
jgi:hypothetical protein